MQPYDTHNIFAKILRGEAPSHKVHEDAATLAFMDVMPRTDGHVLVIPKSPARNLLDVNPEVLAPLILATQRVAIAAMHAMKADGLTVQQFSEHAGGQLVYHLHFHVMPRFEGVALRPHANEMARPEVLADQAARIRAALESAAQR